MKIAGTMTFVFVVVSTGMARADPFTVLPNGSVVFNAELATSGTFNCRSTVPCTGEGTNSITIGSGGNTATLTFTGVTSDFQVSGDSRRVTIGTFEGTASEGFTFPRRENPRVPILDFRLELTHTSPTSSTRGKTFSFFWPGDRPDLTNPRVSNFHVEFPIGSQPPDFHYTGIVYSFLSPSISSNGVRTLEANVGAVPEPSSLLLLAAGVASGAYARRRKRTPEA
jgi:hypothetical protein